MHNDRFECSECQYWTPQKGSLTKHLRKHRTNCKICSEAFETEYAKNKHITDRHKKEFPFECSTCGEPFSVEIDCQLHKRDCKLFHPCHTCEKRFRCGYDLTRHGRTHTGERPFVCTNCYTAFRSKSSLSRHMQNIHGKKAKFEWYESFHQTLSSKIDFIFANCIYYLEQDMWNPAQTLYIYLF